MARRTRTVLAAAWLAGSVHVACSTAEDPGAASSGGTSTLSGGTASGGASSGVASSPSAGGSGGILPPSSGGSVGGLGSGSAGGGGVLGAGGASGSGAAGSGAAGGGGGGLVGGGGASGGVPSAGGSASGGGGGQAGDLCEAGRWDGSTPTALSLSGATFAHDPTMLKVGGTYYRFWTGDFVPMASSDNLTHWTNGPSVYGGSYPAWVSNWLSGVSGATFNFPWAPDVSHFGGQIHLYSSFSARFGDNISCITHLTTSDISAEDWTDHGPVICSTGSENYNAIDADVGLDEAGTPWLVFGSFWDGIMATELNLDGSTKDSALTRVAWAKEIEAPVLFRRCGYYYLFVTWGLCCPGEGRSVADLTYRVAVGRSTEVVGPYVDRSGKPMLEGGGTLVTQGDGVRWAAAGHSDVLADGSRLYHVYHAYAQADGAASLRIVPLFFDDEGWPVPHPP